MAIMLVIGFTILAIETIFTNPFVFAFVLAITVLWFIGRRWKA